MTDALTSLITRYGTLDAPGFATLFLLFFIGSFIPFPRTPLCIAAGLVFGMAALPVVAVSTALGGMLAFIAARYLFQERVGRWLAQKRILAAVLRAVEIEGWRIVALMRFYGPVPSTVQSYAFGLTSINFVAYSLATFLFSIPQLALYTYLGSLGQDTLAGRRMGLIPNSLAIVAFACITLAMALVARRVRAVLRDAQRPSDAVLS